jgi:ubiquinone/menaquinone biosynthesis C-methylase UbiE
MPDARYLHYEDESFDYMHPRRVFHHSDEPEKIVCDLFWILRPGGRLNVLVYAFWSRIILWGVPRYGRKWKQHLENSEPPVHLDLYTGREPKRLFGSYITIEKYQCRPLKSLVPWFGWFLVVKGQKT